eukprot:872742_1
MDPGYYNSYFVAPRDFCYIQTRFRFEDYEVEYKDIINNEDTKDKDEPLEETYDYIVGSFCYTNNNHPYYVNEKLFGGKYNIRGRVIRGGYILAQLDYNSFRAINLFCVDWSGMIPFWYLNNFVLPYSG